MNKLDRIEAKIDKLIEDVHGLHVTHASRITSLEAKQKGVISVLGALIAAASSYVIQFITGSKII